MVDIQLRGYNPLGVSILTRTGRTYTPEFKATKRANSLPIKAMPLPRRHAPVPFSPYLYNADESDKSMAKQAQRRMNGRQGPTILQSGRGGLKVIDGLSRSAFRIS